jgi:SAM-dependent methyltransferase
MGHSIEEAVQDYQQDISANVELVQDYQRLNVSAKYHPEFAAGGYTQDDGTVEFYQRVVAVLPLGATVLDLGAGRGVEFAEGNDGLWRSWLIRLGKKCARRIGADVDPAVKTNPELDQSELVEPGKPLPFADQTFDLILCDWVVEHIEDPQSFVTEIRRVLKVGGWFCARTPNRWGFISIGSRILPKSLEAKVLRVLLPRRHEADVFPKFYRLNTLRAIRERFNDSQWLNATYTNNPGPGHHGNKLWLYNLLSLYQKFTPPSLRTIIHIFARRIA